MSFLNTMRGILRSEGLAPVAGNGPAWISAWRDLAAMVNGIAQDDSRFQPVMAALGRCDAAFERDDLLGFQRAALAVKRAVDGVIS